MQQPLIEMVAERLEKLADGRAGQEGPGAGAVRGWLIQTTAVDQGF